jgi:hypothetical protein
VGSTAAADDDVGKSGSDSCFMGAGHILESVGLEATA